MKLSSTVLLDVMKQCLEPDGSVDINAVREKLDCPMYILSPLVEKLKQEDRIEQLSLSTFKLLS